MKFKRSIIVFLLLILAISIIGCSGTKELTTEEKVEDFEHLYKVIIENYPYIEVNKRMNGIDWEANYDIYLQEVSSTKTDTEFFSVLDELLGDLNNGHTHMLSTPFVTYGRDIYYNFIQEAGKDNWQIYNLEALNNELSLSRYGLEPLNLEDLTGKPDEEDSKKPPIRNASVRNIIEGKVGLIRIPRMIQSNQRELDETLIKQYLDEVKDYQALIIDIRGNGGGDSRYCFDFLIPSNYR